MNKQFGFTRNSLTTIWSSLSAFLVYYSLDSWLTIQGQKPLFSRIIDEREFVAALFGIPIGSFLLFLSFWMLFSYLKHFHSNSNTWDSKYPLFSNLKLNRGTRECKIFQGFCLFIFLIFPLAAQVHFMNKFLDGIAIIRNTETPISIYKLYCPLIFFQKGIDMFRYGVKVGDTENKGVTFFPLYQPVFYVSIQSVVLYLFISYTTSLFQNLKKYKHFFLIVIYLMYFSLIISNILGAYEKVQNSIKFNLKVMV